MPWPMIRKSGWSTCVSVNCTVTVHECTNHRHGVPCNRRRIAIPGVFSLAYFVQNGGLRRSREPAAPLLPLESGERYVR